VKGVPPAVKALVLLALLAAAGVVALKLRSQRTAAPAAPAAAGRHALYFPNATVEVAVAPEASHAVVDFPFENRSNETITIAEVEKNCTCVELGISDSKLTYAPGESGVIRATFELGNLSGTVEKPFALWLKGDPEDQPSHTLTPRMKVPVLIEVSSKTLRWEPGEAALPRMTEITIHHDQPIRVVRATSSLDSFGVSIKAIEEGRRYEVWVTPVEPVAPGLAIIRVETDSPIPRWQAVNFFAPAEAKPQPSPAPTTTP